MADRLWSWQGKPVWSPAYKGKPIWSWKGLAVGAVLGVICGALSFIIDHWQ
jgi:hypothetical protein